MFTLENVYLVTVLEDLPAEGPGYCLICYLFDCNM